MSGANAQCLLCKTGNRTRDDTPERNQILVVGVLAHGQLFFSSALAAHPLAVGGAVDATPDLLTLSPSGTGGGGESERNGARAVGRPAEDRRRRNEAETSAANGSPGVRALRTATCCSSSRGRERTPEASLRMSARSAARSPLGPQSGPGPEPTGVCRAAAGSGPKALAGRPDPRGRVERWAEIRTAARGSRPVPSRRQRALKW